MKCKLLKGESDKISSLLTYKPRHVHGWNEQNNETKQFKGCLCELCCLGIHQRSTFQKYQIYQSTEYIRMFTIESSKGNSLIHM